MRCWEAASKLERELVISGVSAVAENCVVLRVVMLICKQETARKREQTFSYTGMSYGSSCCDSPVAIANRAQIGAAACAVR